MTQPIPPQSQTFFHGKITREQAEEILLRRNDVDGSFLLRESVNGNYSISICHNGRVHHYNIELQSDGTYQIPTGGRFIGPVELIKHHSQHLDGFLTLAKYPLERSPQSMSYFVLQGITYSDLEERLRLKILQMGLKGTSSIDDVLNGPMRDHIRQLVLQDLHHCQPWFHECIRRSDAELRLQEAGHTDGQFLVRYRKEDNSYVLSLSYLASAKHYKINCSFNKLQIEGGQFFASLIEMIDHYHFRQDGLLCKLRYAVESPRQQRFRSGVNPSNALSTSGTSTPNSLFMPGDKSTPPQSRSTSSSRPSTMTSQNQGPLPTFSSESSSESSSAGGLVPTNPFGLPGPETKSPADLISFAEWANISSLINSNMSPMRNNVTKNEAIPSSDSRSNLSQVFHTQPPIQLPPPPSLPSSAVGALSTFNLSRDNVPDINFDHSTGFTPTPTPDNFHAQHPWPSPHGPLSVTTNDSMQDNSLSSPGQSSSTGNPSPKITPNQTSKSSNHKGLNQASILNETWEEPEFVQHSSIGQSDSCTISPRKGQTQHPHSNNSHFWNDTFSENTQIIYDALPVDDETFDLDPSQISIKEKLGGGNFGHVFGGLYYPSNGGKEVPVAIKMLKQDQVSSVNQDEIMSEARVMSQLKHRHIVRLIGICRNIQVMLVLEIAPLGPINKYLRKNPAMSYASITELMIQVALGMTYLEMSKFVHRDLAARNVLLVNEKYAKISDFGMSKALKFGNDYYRAANAGKWPIKWYAPECIYYFKFDSKSDVWSYGITLWEVFSYGDRPYRDMKGTQILSMIDRGKRLGKPVGCPDNIYDVMVQCWEFDGVRRPTFADLTTIMARINHGFYSAQSGCAAGVQLGELSSFSPLSGTK